MVAPRLRASRRAAARTPALPARGERPSGLLLPSLATRPCGLSRGCAAAWSAQKWTGLGYPGKGDPGWLYIPYLRLPVRLESGRRRADFFVVLEAFQGESPPQRELQEIPASASAGPRLAGSCRAMRRTCIRRRRRPRARLDSRADRDQRTIIERSFNLAPRADGFLRRGLAPGSCRSAKDRRRNSCRTSQGDSPIFAETTIATCPTFLIRRS